MIQKESITKENFSELRLLIAKKRESDAEQEEILSDIRLLRNFAIENSMMDDAVELFLEEALVHQHAYMKEADSRSLQAMQEVVNQAGLFVQTNHLPQWESRIARFLGRIADYEKNYQAAAEHYQEALAKITLDPQYSQNKALSFEYAGFLIMDELRLTDSQVAITKALKLYEDYEQTAEGQALKTKDYTTWAIWRSGLLINLSRTLIDLGKLELFRKQIEVWLVLAEKDLQPPSNVEAWSDFSFRKKEITDIKEKFNS